MAETTAEIPAETSVEAPAETVPEVPVETPAETLPEKGVLKITSPAFQELTPIPSQYTCGGVNISPPLEWTGVPENAKSLILIMDDPDAAPKTWAHWVVFNISPATTALPEKIKIGKNLENGGVQGLTDFKKNGYGGPCPPAGTHRYVFKLYALDILVDLAPVDATKDQLLSVMQKHVLAEGQFTAIYEHKK